MADRSVATTDTLETLRSTYNSTATDVGDIANINATFAGTPSDLVEGVGSKAHYTGQADIVTVGTIATGTWQATDVAVAHGGTGASTESDARTNLGVAIGSDVQAYNATLDNVAAGTYAGDNSIVTVGTIATGTWQGTAVADTYVADDLTISGGTVDNSVIGGTTPAAITGTQVDITAQGDLRLQDTTGGQYVALQAPGTVSASWTATLPAAVGSSGQALRTSNASGTLEWFTPEVGDITGVTAGTGLSGGGTSGTVSLAVETSQTQITALGTIATGTWEATDVAVAHGGTGSSTASTARTALGVAIGSDVQAFDSDNAVTDVVQTFTAGQRGEVTTLTSATSVAIDLANSNNYVCTMGHNITFDNPTNAVAGQSGSIFLIQDGIGGRTGSWGANWDWAAGTAPTLTTTAAAVDRIDYIVRSATSIHAVATLNLS
jgi:hypothetical protein